MDGRLILVGQVAGAFGAKGELRITAFTADPLSLLAYGALRAEDGSEILKLAAGRAVKGGLIARAEPALTRSEAESLRGLKLFVERSAFAALDEEDYYVADLVGLEAISPAGETIGQVKSVANFGAGDLLEIDPSDGSPTWWAPFTQAAVPSVRLAERQLTIDRAAAEGTSFPRPEGEGGAHA
jgi:16S rRNA processing protein RimM